MQQPHAAVGPRLSAMMFLQFFVWGAWYVTVGNYMAKVGLADWIGTAYTVGPIAALISPFFLGMVADRFFSTERVLATLHIVGGIAMLLAPAAAASGSEMFIAVLLLHMLCYMPTLGLVNTLSFANMTRPEKQFPLVRVFGTIGWIAANWVVSKFLHADFDERQFYVTGAAAIALGAYSFTLPHTPPPNRGKKTSAREVLGLDALALLKQTPFAVFVVSSLLICIPLAGYYAYAGVFVNHTGFRDPAFTMSFGQISEIFFMLVMPLFFARLGVKWMLAVGMFAWVVRYGLFATAADDGVLWMVLGGILLHGICYDFFFVTGFIYTERKAPAALRGQAQGLLVLVTQGLGLGIGAQAFQWLVNENKSQNFDALTRQAEGLRTQFLALPEAARDAPGLWDQATQLLLETYNWGKIWMAPAVMALVILIGFVLLFKDRAAEQAAAVSEAEVAKNAVPEQAA